MKLWLVGIVAVLSTGALGAQAVDRNYDKFKDYTSFTVKDVTAESGGFTGHNLDMMSFYTCKGDTQSCSPEIIELLFSRSDTDWQFLDDHTFVLLLDGKERIDCGEKGYDGSVGSGYVLEYQSVQLSPEQFHKIAAATTVEGQWGSHEFKFSDKSLKAIRALAASIPPDSTR